MPTNYRMFSRSPVNTALLEELVDLRDMIPDLKLNPRFENPGFHTFNLGATDSLRVRSSAQLLFKLLDLDALFFCCFHNIVGLCHRKG